MDNADEKSNSTVWTAPPPPYLGEPGTEQFTSTVEVNGRKISTTKIHDPFAAVTVVIDAGEVFRSLLRWLIGGPDMRVLVSIRGSYPAERRIMTMNPVEMERENRDAIEAYGRSLGECYRATGAWRTNS